jgi:hypothetical protein
VHYYNRFGGPIWKGRIISNGTHNPRGVLHSCSGNGGPPCSTGSMASGACSDGSLCKCNKGPYPQHCAVCEQRPSYTRLTVHNATDLLWEQVLNVDSSVVDSWTVHQEQHGPFATPP